MKKNPLIFFLVSIVSCITISCSSPINVSRETFTRLPEKYTIFSQKSGVETYNWWEKFDNKELNALLEEAFKNNLDLHQTIARLKQAEALAKISRSTIFPTINIGGSASRDKQFSSFGETLGTTYRGSISASYEIDLWEKIKNNATASELLKKAAREDVKTAYMILAAQVTDLYFFIAEQQNQKKLFENIVRSLKDTRTKVEARYVKGVADPLDVYQARQSILVAETSLPIIEANIKTAKNELMVVSGEVPNNSITIDLNDISFTPPRFNIGIPADLLHARPDITAAFLRVQSKNFQLAAAIADKLPAIETFATYGESGLKFAGQTLSGNFWSLLVDIAMPILDGGRRKGEVEKAKAELEELITQFHKTVLNAVKEVENAAVRVDETEEKVQILLKRVDISQATLRLAEKNYYEGLTNYIEVQIAQRNLYDAQSLLIGAQREMISETISLARATGGLWLDEQLIKLSAK